MQEHSSKDKCVTRKTEDWEVPTTEVYDQVSLKAGVSANCLESLHCIRDL